jgi:hypothetical protein
MIKLPGLFKKFNPKYSYMLSGFFLALGLFFLLTNVYFVSDKDVKTTVPSVSGAEFQKIYSPPIPSSLDFAGESVPLENFDVFERIDREFLVNTYWHSFTILAIKRAARWFPVIEPILKKNKIPDDFKYVVVIESGLYNAVSPAGATGFWQITEPVAKKYSLEINDEIDERYDVEKSTEAACSYIKDAYALFNNWTLAAASFNMGLNGVGKQLERQKTNNYYNLALNEETSRYIARIIAVKQILKNPEKYGYFISESELYKPLKSTNVEVSGNISNFADFATIHGINYKTLKLYNPWLRDISLTNKSHNIYKIKIPEKGTINLIK